MGLTKFHLAKLMPCKKKSRMIVEAILEAIKGSLEKGEEVKISGFGKWRVLQKKSRLGRNPKTGERMEITPRKVVVFRPSKIFDDALYPKK